MNYRLIIGTTAGILALGALFTIPGMRAIYIGYLAASVCICLPLIYHITAPDWHRSEAGRALMTLLASLAALFILINVCLGRLATYLERRLSQSRGGSRSTTKDTGEAALDAEAPSCSDGCGRATRRPARWRR